MIRSPERFSPEEELAVLLSYVQPTQANIGKIERLFGDVRDWQYFLDTVTFNRVRPMCAMSLGALSLRDRVPEFVLQSLEKQHEKIRVRNQKRNKEAKLFLERFVSWGMPVAILKGVGLAQSLYSDVGYKKMNDIDILIKKVDVQRAIETYEELDYFAIGERTSRDMEDDALSFTAPTYIKRDLSCVVGTQWGITFEGMCDVDYEGFWNRALPFTFEGLALKQLCPEDNLLHLCIHLDPFKISIRDLMDLYNLVAVTSGFDWSLFMESTKKAKAWVHVYHALVAMNELRVDDEVERRIEECRRHVSTKNQKLIAERRNEPEKMLHVRVDVFQDMEKAFSRFLYTNRLGPKIRAFAKSWSYVLWPDEDTMSKVTYQNFLGPRNRWRARVTYPRRFLWGITTFEVPPKLFGFFAALSVLKLGKTACLTLVGKGGTETSLADIAARGGMTVDELLALSESFE